MKVGPLGVLRHREFLVVWIAHLISDMGMWMQIAALGIYVAQSTEQAAWVGLVTTATYLAIGIVSPFTGALSDRFDRRKLVAVTVVGAAAFAIALIIATSSGNDSPLLLWALAAGQGALTAAKYPAVSAMIPDLVPGDRVSQATSMQHVSWNLGRSLGPLAGVGLVAVMSVEAVFAFNGLALLVLAGSMALISVHPRHINSGSITRQIGAGVAALRSNPTCRYATWVNAAEAAFIAPVIALIPVMAILTLGGAATDTGALYAAQGIGSVVGVLAVASLIPRLGQLRAVSVSLGGAALCLLGYATSPSVLFAALWIIPLSGFHTSVLAGCTALGAKSAPPAMRGRILGLFATVYNITYAVAALLVAVTADLFGLRPALAVSAVLMIGFVVITTRHRDRTSFDNS